jgi:hypothetical protein
VPYASAVPGLRTGGKCASDLSWSDRRRLKGFLRIPLKALFTNSVASQVMEPESPLTETIVYSVNRKKNHEWLG